MTSRRPSARVLPQESDYGHDLEEDEAVEYLGKLPTLESILMAPPTRSQRGKSQIKRPPEGSKDEGKGEEEDEERRVERKREEEKRRQREREAEPVRRNIPTRVRDAQGHTSTGNKNEPDSKGAAQ